MKRSIFLLLIFYFQLLTPEPSPDPFKHWRRPVIAFLTGLSWAYLLRPQGRTNQCLATLESAAKLSYTCFLVSLTPLLNAYLQRNSSSNSSYYREYEPDLNSRQGFALVAGGVPEQLQQLKDYLTNFEAYKAMNVDCPTGFLLYGPPGTGKTLLGRALAQELDAIFLEVKASELNDKYRGEAARRVGDLYAYARKKSLFKCVIIFIDEVDAIAPHRQDGMHASTESLTRLLSEIDGFHDKHPVITIGTTNIPNHVDPALLRNGRLGVHIFVPLPDKEKRQAIFAYYINSKPHDLALVQLSSLEALAEETEGASGAGIKDIVNQAAMLAVQLKRNKIIAADLAQAIVNFKKQRDNFDLIY